MCLFEGNSRCTAIQVVVPGRCQLLEPPMTPKTPMETFHIPGTNLTPSRIGLGTWAMGGWMWGGTDDAESVATIRAALDQGINLIDTAPAYGFGRSEEIVGKAIAEVAGRAKVLSPPKSGWNGRMGKCIGTPTAGGSCPRSMPLCVGFEPTTSTSIKCIGPIRTSPSNKPPARCASCSTGKNPRHRREQFLGVADASLPRGSPTARAAGAVQPVRACD